MHRSLHHFQSLPHYHYIWHSNDHILNKNLKMKQKNFSLKFINLFLSMKENIDHLKLIDFPQNYLNLIKYIIMAKKRKLVLLFSNFKLISERGNFTSR